MPGTRKLGRPTAHRNAMLRGMVTLLLENGQVETTLTRAKEVRSMAEKMITLGKKNTLASRRAALAYITKEDVVTKVFSELAPLYAERNGGYTQIYKLGPRRGDVDTLNSYFGYTIQNNRGKPTNSEFIAMIADNLRLKYKMYQ